MFSKRIKVGAICHALLPEISPIEDEQDVFKYVDSSVAKMVDTFTDLGVKRDEIELKCFGGGDMFDVISDINNTVGKQNILILRKTLRHLKLYAISEDMGGNYGRQIYFNTLTGEVLRKKVMKISNG